MYRKIFCFFIFSVFSACIFSQSISQNKWVDSVMNNLSEEERIAQLLMVSAYSNKDKNHTDKIESLIKDYKIGGLMFLQGGPVRQQNHK